MSIEDFYAALLAIAPEGGTVFARRCFATFSTGGTLSEYDASVYTGAAGQSEHIFQRCGENPHTLLAQAKAAFDAWRDAQRSTAEAHDTWAAIQAASEAAHG